MKAAATVREKNYSNDNEGGRTSNKRGLPRTPNERHTRRHDQTLLLGGREEERERREKKERLACV